MKKIIYFLFILLSFQGYSQVQIGQDIYGDAEHNRLGWSVSLSSDGTTLAVGAPQLTQSGTTHGNGFVRVYRNVNNNWTQIGSDLIGAELGDEFGYSISLSSDGTVIAIGAHQPYSNDSKRGYVRLYKNINDVWTQIGSDIFGENLGDQFGFDLKLSSDGSIVAIGAPYNDGNGDRSGHVRIYKNMDDVWTQIGDDIDGEFESDLSGFRVGLSSDGSVVTMSAISYPNGDGLGQVRIFKNVNDVWTQIGDDIYGQLPENNGGNYELLGNADLKLSADGSLLAVSSTIAITGDQGIGFVRIYKNVNDEWIQVGSDINGETVTDLFGHSFGISNDGSIIAVGAPGNDANASNSGHVRVFQNINDTWVQVGEDIEGENVIDGTGTSLSLSSDGFTLAVTTQSDENGNNSGRVRVYSLVSVLSSTTYDLNSFDIYPNPAKDEFNVQLSDGTELERVRVHNNIGQLIIESKELNISTKNWAQGIYFVEVTSNKGRSIKKLIIE